MRKSLITAKIIQDSVSNDTRLTTFELEYPRFIHAELMTHRQFSRNSASSRAIPTERMLEQVRRQPAVPVEWGQNQSGMQARELIQDPQQAETEWLRCAQATAEYAKRLHDLGVHKQLANRVTEPFQTMKVVVSATEYQNWFDLRAHPDAQPEIQQLAYAMCKELKQSEPLQLIQGDWHVPYVDRVAKNGQVYYEVSGEHCSKEQARLVSASCCAQVSYRRLDQTLAKALQIAQRLVAGRPWHASPFEHQARPVQSLRLADVPELGITHIDRLNQQWSGNFRNWIQHRQLLEQA
jgi:hypothetical protein